MSSRNSLLPWPEAATGADSNATGTFTQQTVQEFQAQSNQDSQSGEFRTQVSTTEVTTDINEITDMSQTEDEPQNVSNAEHRHISSLLSSLRQAQNDRAAFTQQLEQTEEEIQALMRDTGATTVFIPTPDGLTRIRSNREDSFVATIAAGAHQTAESLFDTFATAALDGQTEKPHGVQEDGRNSEDADAGEVDHIVVVPTYMPHQPAIPIVAMHNRVPTPSSDAINNMPTQVTRDNDDSDESAEELGARTRYVDEQTACRICGDNLDLANTVFLNCGHIFCHDCLNECFRIGMSGKSSFPPKCCGADGIPIDTVLPFLEEDLIIRYTVVEEEYSTRQPTFCANKTCSCFFNQKKIEKAVGKFVVCHQCDTETCFECKQARSRHRDQDEKCPDLISKEDKELADGQRWKQCPGCKCLVERGNGCNHMTCECGTEFCYECGEEKAEDNSCGCRTVPDQDGWHTRVDDGEIQANQGPAFVDVHGLEGQPLADVFGGWDIMQGEEFREEHNEVDGEDHGGQGNRWVRDEHNHRAHQTNFQPGTLRETLLQGTEWGIGTPVPLMTSLPANLNFAARMQNLRQLRDEMESMRQELHQIRTRAHGREYGRAAFRGGFGRGQTPATNFEDTIHSIRMDDGPDGAGDLLAMAAGSLRRMFTTAGRRGRGDRVSRNTGGRGRHGVFGLDRSAAEIQDDMERELGIDGEDAGQRGHPEFDDVTPRQID